MSLTMLVRGLLAIFAAALVVMSAVNLASSWGAYSTAQRVQQINAVSDALLEATENLAVERGTTNTALRAAERADEGTLKAIETRRTNSAAALERARDGLTRISFANDRTLTADMDGAIQRLDALRAQADRALTQPQNAREAGAVNQWMPTVVGAMEAIADLSGAVGFEIKLTDPFIGEQTALKENAWTVRDFAGRQRAAMGAAIAAQRGLTVQEQTAIAAHRGRVEQAWTEIEAMSQRVGAPQEVIQAVADVKQTYFTRFGDESGRVLETLSKGQAVSMTGSEWYALSNPPLASIMSVKDASVTVTEAYARSQVNGALWSLTLNGLLMIGALALTAAVFLLTTKRLANPLAALIGTVEQLTEEKFDIDVPCREQSDELGQMAKALDTLRLQAAEAQALRADAAAKQAAELERAQKIAGLTQDFDEQVTKALQIVEAAATELEASAQSLSSISDDASKSATIAASAAEQTTANVQTVAAATEEMSSSIQEITRQMNGSLTVSNEAVSEVKRTNGIVQGLASSAQKIGDVIGLINDIAEQTNLLALNATIEAARAGEHGKGFAVVASEVKTLANQTARATDEISEQISSMQSVTQTAVDAIETIGKTIMQINENIEAIAAAAEEQGVATQEISRNVQEAAQGTQQVSDSIDDVRQRASETDSMANGVLGASSDLNREADSLKSRIAQFLQAVRAA